MHRSGSALYILHDVDGNGYNDVFALAVRGEGPEVAEFANIHDYTRLYKPDPEMVKFYVRLFYQRNGTLEPADLVSVGEQLVVDSYAPRSVVEGARVPFAVSIVFTTPQGRVREWVIFTDGKPGRFRIQERTGELPRIEDIDGDGIVDVVMYEEDFEVGIGNETYMTWYRWSGNDFVRHRSVNVVRNLRTFLSESIDLAKEGDWAGFSSVAISENETIDVTSLISFEVFQRVFSLAAADESFRNTEIGEEDRIRRAVYPEIRENPFTQRDAMGFYFPLTVRFETSGGRNHLYTARVYMAPNPFGERQFFFGIGEALPSEG